MLLAVVLSLTFGAPDLSSLKSTERQAFDSIAREEFCHCKSALTIAGCLDLRPDCRLAVHLGYLIARGLENGGSQSDVLSFLSQRVMGPFCSSEHSFKLEGAPEVGPKTAPLVLVEFADFRCGHCKHAAPAVKAALKRYGGRVRLIFIPFPLSNHPLSIMASEAALAAHAQGKFAELSEAMFAYDGELDEAAVNALAKRVGMDTRRFERDMTKHTFHDRVLALKQEGTDAGINGTPSFFVNGRAFEFDPGLYTFGTRFDMEIDRNKGSCQ